MKHSGCRRRDGRGDGGFLLDEERPDVPGEHRQPPPGSARQAPYVTELSVSRRGLRFSIPTTVSPRYAPAEDRAAVGRSDAEALNPPRAWKVPYGLELSLRLSMTGTISRLESPSHPVSVSMNGPSTSVTLSTREAALDRDFVLSIDADGLDRPQGWAEQDDEARVPLAVAFVPDPGLRPRRATSRS
jgi:Ca-activated chloride channel family protein